MKTLPIRTCAAFLTLLALSACGNGTPKPGTDICNGPALQTLQLVYPAADAVGVPDGGFTLVLGSAGSSLVGPIELNGSAIRATAVPSPLPTPNAGTTQPYLFAFSVGPLASKTTYSLNEAIAPGTACASVYLVGTFTTQ